MSALQQRNRAVTDEELKRRITEKFIDGMFSTDRDTHFFMGNFEKLIKRDKFSVLGICYPRVKDVEAMPLF